MGILMIDSTSLPPDDFIAILDGWSNTGGEIPNRIAYNQRLSTSEEVRAVARALRSGRVYDAEAFTQPLHSLAAYFQNVDKPSVIAAIRAEGLPALRPIVDRAVEDRDDTNEAAYDKASSQLLALRVLVSYGEPGDGARVAAAARNPRLVDDWLWSSILAILADGHPDMHSAIDALRDPLPVAFAGIAFLDACNGLAMSDATFRHPYATPAGVARLSEFIDRRDPDKFSYAVSAAASIPFHDVDSRAVLLTKAEMHPDALVQLEGAWASAKAGDEPARHRLAFFASNPSWSQRAIAYLDELGLQQYIPKRATEPDFMALSEMAGWLAHPNEMGRPPDRVTIYDTRTLNWPPTDDRRQLWLVRYAYDGEESKDGIGMVGSVTFALFGEATADLPAEDVYGMHCAWELEMEDDSRAPPHRTAAAGRQLLAAANPGFPT